MEKKKVETCICGSTAELCVKEKTFFGGRVVLRNYEYYRCKRGHEYLTSEQASRHDEEFRRQYFVHRQIISTGRSLAVTFPSDFVDFYNLKKGKKITIVPAGKKEALLRFD